jgi:hypothetical protein
MGQQPKDAIDSNEVQIQNTSNYLADRIGAVMDSHFRERWASLFHRPEPEVYARTLDTSSGLAVCELPARAGFRSVIVKNDSSVSVNLYVGEGLGGTPYSVIPAGISEAIPLRKGVHYIAIAPSAAGTGLVRLIGCSKLIPFFKHRPSGGGGSQTLQGLSDVFVNDIFEQTGTPLIYNANAGGLGVGGWTGGNVPASSSQAVSWAGNAHFAVTFEPDGSYAINGDGTWYALAGNVTSPPTLAAGTLIRLRGWALFPQGSNFWGIGLANTAGTRIVCAAIHAADTEAALRGSFGSAMFAGGESNAVNYRGFGGDASYMTYFEVGLYAQTGNNIVAYCNVGGTWYQNQLTDDNSNLEGQVIIPAFTCPGGGSVGTVQLWNTALTVSTGTGAYPGAQ